MNKLKQKINSIDFLIVFIFAIYATMYFLGRWSGMPSFNFLEGDIANSTSFAVAKDFPSLFSKDAVLGDPNNFKVYWVIQSWLIRKLAIFTHDYGLATCFLLGPHIFLHFLSFYILGRLIYDNRGWAFILAVFASHFTPFKLGDFWGIYFDILPRFTFQALLPLLLAIAYLKRKEYKFWPLVMILAGLLMYVHPVSTPGIAFSVWLGFWLFLPSVWSWPKKVAWMFLMGIVFLATVSPFMYNYLNNFDHGVKPNYDQIYQIMVERYAIGYFNIPYALKRFFQHMWDAKFYFAGLVSLLIMLLWKKDQQKKSVLLLLFWLIGVCIIGMLVPFVEQEICKALKALPPEIDLVRTIRYSIPLTIIALVWFLRELSVEFCARTKSKVPGVVALLIVGFIVIKYFGPTWGHPQRTYDAWKAGLLIPEPPEAWDEVNKNIEAIKELVPKGEALFVVEGVDELVVRYSALRPVVYSFKDGGILGYSNHNKLIKWRSDFDNFRESYAKQDRIRAYYRMARKRGASYLVVGWAPDSKDMQETSVRDKIEVLYHNKWLEYKTMLPMSMTLLKLNP